MPPAVALGERGWCVFDLRNGDVPRITPSHDELHQHQWVSGTDGAPWTRNAGLERQTVRLTVNYAAIAVASARR